MVWMQRSIPPMRNRLVIGFAPAIRIAKPCGFSDGTLIAWWFGNEPDDTRLFAPQWGMRRAPVRSKST
jgi:hypothetical protein